MSFKVKIIDNDTGDVLVDENKAGVIIGAICNEKTVHCMSFVRASPADIYQTMGGVQNILAKLSEDHPEFSILGQIEDFVKKLEKKNKEES